MYISTIPWAVFVEKRKFEIEPVRVFRKSAESNCALLMMKSLVIILYIDATIAFQEVDWNIL